jgi:MFS transporter, AAHS family, 4-hydroxybenzoate transporter
LTNDRPLVDIAAVIDTAPFGAVCWGVCVLSFLIIITDGFDIQSMAFVAPALTAAWNLRRELLGPVLTASIVGMAVGSVLLGWLGDRIGRKSSFCAAMALLAVGSLASTGAGSLTTLTLYRFLTGIGLGGAAPLAAALVAEWTPRRWRGLTVAVVIVAVPIGGIIGAALSQRLIPVYGWRSIFLAGAVTPLALLAVAWSQLPESPKYLAGRPSRAAELARLLNRLVQAQRFDARDHFVVIESEAARRGALIDLLRRPYLATTLLLWLAFSCNTLVLYGFVNWLPTVLSSAGASLKSALNGSLLFNIGGLIGAVSGSILIGRYGSRIVGSSIALGGAAAAFLIGRTAFSEAHLQADAVLLLTFVAAAGASLNGMQAFLFAVAAHSYPTPIRSSGVGSAAAVSRVGGALSSAVGSSLFALGLPSTTFFYILASIALATTVSFFSLRRHIPGREP